MSNPSRVVVVTGAAGSIGRAAAIRWANHGFRVAAVDLSMDQVRELASAHPNIRGFECDVADEGSVGRTATEIRSALGPIDRLCTAAAVLAPERIGAAPPSAFRRSMEVNFFGTMHWVEAVLPEMLARRAGEIVTVGSMSSFICPPNPYGPSKFAVLGYSLSLAEFLRDSGIRVFCVIPPVVDTVTTATLRAAGVSAKPAWYSYKPMSVEDFLDGLDAGFARRDTLVIVGRRPSLIRRLHGVAPELASRLHRKMLGRDDRLREFPEQIRSETSQ